MTERAQIDAETLMAYADGELSPIEARRVERAIAADPMLKEQVDAHRKLRAMLANGFAPLMDSPVPDRLASLLNQAPVTDLAQARASRAARIGRSMAWRGWGTGMAIAASLIVGILIGGLGKDGPVTSSGGALIASGSLSRTLDTQLASAQGAGSPVRVLATFRNQQGAVCRSFTGAALSGIACHGDNGWQLHETRSGVAGQGTQYQQAGSADAALMADAQAMMTGDPFDADAEAKARAQGWR